MNKNTNETETTVYGNLPTYPGTEGTLNTCLRTFLGKFSDGGYYGIYGRTDMTHDAALLYFRSLRNSNSHLRDCNGKVAPGALPSPRSCLSQRFQLLRCQPHVRPTRQDRDGRGNRSPFADNVLNPSACATRYGPVLVSAKCICVNERLLVYAVERRSLAARATQIGIYSTLACGQHRACLLLLEAGSLLSARNGLGAFFSLRQACTSCCILTPLVTHTTFLLYITGWGYRGPHPVMR